MTTKEVNEIEDLKELLCNHINENTELEKELEIYKKLIPILLNAIEEERQTTKMYKTLADKDKKIE